MRASRLPTTTTVGRSTEASSARTSWAAIDAAASASVADGVAAIISRVSSTMRAVALRPNAVLARAAETLVSFHG